MKNISFLHQELNSLTSRHALKLMSLLFIVLFIFAGCKKGVRNLTVHCINIKTGEGIEGIEFLKPGLKGAFNKKNQEFIHTDIDGKLYANTLRDLDGMVLTINDSKGYVRATGLAESTCNTDNSVEINSKYVPVYFFGINVLSLSLKTSEPNISVRVSASNNHQCSFPIDISLRIENNELPQTIYTASEKLNFPFVHSESQIELEIFKLNDSLNSFPEKGTQFKLEPFTEDTLVFEIDLDKL